jgi:hypothetical protein
VLRELRALVADDPPEVRSKLWYDMLAPVFGYGESELARQIYERFDRHAREDENPWEDAEAKRDWILGQPGSGKVEERLAPRFPQITLTRLWPRPLGEGLEVEPETVVRLLLADQLPDVDRVVVLPHPAVATADGVKPWHAELTPERERWRAYRTS